jgi:hypothetical protein
LITGFRLPDLPIGMPVVDFDGNNPGENTIKHRVEPVA